MKKICLATIISMGLLAFTHAYAAPVCEYFDDVGFVYISGSAGSDYANKTVNIMLKEKNNDTPDNDSLVYIADFKTDANGDYVYKFKINLAQSADNYIVHSRIGNQDSERTGLIKGEWLLTNLPEYDRNNNKMSFSGLYKYESEDKDLRIKIKGGKLDEITEWDSGILYESQISMNENGLFNIAVDLSENNIVPGWYSFKVFDDITNCESKSEFEIYDINSVLGDINTYIKNEKASELLTYITSKSDILGIDNWEITEGVKIDALTVDMLTLLINNDNNVADIKELQLEIQRAYATDLINKLADNDYDGARDILFTTFKDLFGIEQLSYYKEYKNLKNNNKEETVLSNITAKAGGFESFKTVLDTLSEKTLIAAINNVEFWNQVQDIVLTNGDYFTLENIPTQVWKDICEERPFDTISNFEKRCNELKKSNNTTSKPSGNGGGGGGGGGMTVIGKPATPTEEKAPENFTQTENNIQNNTQADDSATFNDVPKEHWAYNSIEYLYEKQIVNGAGEGKFLPDVTLKREELIKMLVTATGNLPTEGEESFTDVEKDKWYAGYIAAAKALGITFGKNNGSFGVGEALTREDAAVLCYRALNMDFEETADELNFNDKDLISDYAKQAVAKMVKLGILNGKNDGNFAPKDYCTRAEAAKILYGILEGVSK